MPASRALLPLQVVNLGRKGAVLGNMRVTAEGAELSNNTILVGALDIGGYYTLDTTVIPDQPGPLELTSPSITQMISTRRR